VELVRSEEFYTFPLLTEAPKFSLKGLGYLGLEATVNYEGNPWDIMRENGFVYNIGRESLSLKESILTLASPALSGYCFLSTTPLIQPGSRNEIGRQVLSYDGEFNVESFHLKLSEFGYE
jgi:hypothetical protein